MELEERAARITSKSDEILQSSAFACARRLMELINMGEKPELETAFCEEILNALKKETLFWIVSNLKRFDESHMYFVQMRARESELQDERTKFDQQCENHKKEVKTLTDELEHQKSVIERLNSKKLQLNAELLKLQVKLKENKEDYAANKHAFESVINEFQQCHVLQQENWNKKLTMLQKKHDDLLSTHRNQVAASNADLKQQSLKLFDFVHKFVSRSYYSSADDLDRGDSCKIVKDCVDDTKQHVFEQPLRLESLVVNGLVAGGSDCKQHNGCLLDTEMDTVSSNDTHITGAVFVDEVMECDSKFYVEDRSFPVVAAQAPAHNDLATAEADLNKLVEMLKESDNMNSLNQTMVEEYKETFAGIGEKDYADNKILVPPESNNNESFFVVDEYEETGSATSQESAEF